MTQVTKLRRLSRLSHFMLNSPSVTLRSGSVYFSVSAVEELQIHKFKSSFGCDHSKVKYSSSSSVSSKNSLDLLLCHSEIDLLGLELKSFQL